MAKFAENTKVPVSQSKGEIETLLTRYGADQFASGWMASRAVVTFRMNSRHIRIELPLPALEPKTESWNKKKGLYYEQNSLDKEVRRRWRALLLYVKAKLESVESDIISFEEAFLPHIVIPGGKTIAQAMLPQVKAAYESGKMPPLLGFDG